MLRKPSQFANLAEMVAKEAHLMLGCIGAEYSSGWLSMGEKPINSAHFSGALFEGGRSWRWTGIQLNNTLDGAA